MYNITNFIEREMKVNIAVSINLCSCDAAYVVFLSEAEFLYYNIISCISFFLLFISSGMIGCTVFFIEVI